MQLDNEFSVSKVNCDGNTLLLSMGGHCSAKTVLKISISSLKSTIYLLLWNIGGIHAIFCHLVEFLTRTSNI